MLAGRARLGAAARIGRSPRNLIAFGDAENDLPLFALAEIAVVARGSVPTVAAADDQLRLPGAAGVADWVRGLLERGGTMPTPRRLAIELGTADDGTPAVLPADVRNVLVTGDPRSGQSWVAGLAAECLVEAGYRVCVFGPESDHVAVGYRPGAIGREIGLPSPRRRDGAGACRRERRPRAHVAAAGEEARLRRPRAPQHRRRARPVRPSALDRGGRGAR